MTSREEIQARVAALSSGPWIEQSQLAIAALDPPYLGVSVAPDGSFDLRGNVKLSVDHPKIAKLAHVLRPHSSNDEIEPELYKIRESFDEALGHLQLIELAIATGYVEVSAVNELVRRRMFALLWSIPAKQYARFYGFVLLRSLAARVSVHLYDDGVTPNEAIEGGDIRFAAFLGELTSWFGYPALDDFLNMLDDYEPGGTSSAALARAITTSGAFSDEEMHLLIGADAFVMKAASIFGPLNDVERPLYGGYLSYWLAKFFGYRMEGQKYVRDETIVDWSVILLNDVLLSEVGWRSYQDAITVLRNAWNSTRLFIGVVLETERQNRLKVGR